MTAAFLHIKETLLAGFGLSQDAMHIHVGLVLYFALHLLLRRKLGDVLPLTLLLAVCLTGEIFDIIIMGGRGHDLRWLESARDIWNTLFWPALFTVYGRWGPKRSKP